jgi:hypothetical protein
MSMDPFSGAEGSIYPTDATHPNPMFDFLTGFVPRKLKDLFKWAEFLAYSSAHVYAVIKKFGEYPITKLEYTTNNDAAEQRHKELFEVHLPLKGFCTTISFDKHLYGNGFISIYEPIKRWLVCPSCTVKTDIQYVAYEYNPDRVLFKFRCPNKKCQKTAQVRPTDEKLKDASKINLIRWDPKLMDIKHNPVTGHSTYYYTLPPDLIQDVRKGDRTILDHLPLEFLTCVQKKTTFKFGPDALYHLKVPGPAGVQAHWGFPPITAAIKLFLFAATLRKANEAIAMEHIVPMRILYPQASSVAGDPISQINLAQWRHEIEENYRRFRRDPLHVMIAPVPVGVQDVGGQGRALLTIQEVQEAEKNIMLSMGVPPEFLLGGLGTNKGEITLRMIENQLQTHIEDLNKMVAWIERKVSAFLGYDSIPTRLADFKMLDDSERKQFLLELWKAGKLGDGKVMETVDLDARDAREERKQEAIDETRMQMEMQSEVSKLQNSLAAQAQQKATMGAGLSYNVQAIVQAAQQQAQQLSGMDEGSRKSALAEMQSTDPVMYAVTVQQLEQITTSQEAQARAQTRQAG